MMKKEQTKNWNILPRNPLNYTNYLMAELDCLSQQLDWDTSVSNSQHVTHIALLLISPFFCCIFLRYISLCCWWWFWLQVPHSYIGGVWNQRDNQRFSWGPSRWGRQEKEILNPKTILAADRLADIQCSRIYVSDKAEMHREAGYSYKLPRGEDIMPITLGGTTYRAALTLTQHLLSPHFSWNVPGGSCGMHFLHLLRSQNTEIGIWICKYYENNPRQGKP